MHINYNSFLLFFDNNIDLIILIINAQGEGGLKEETSGMK